MSPRALVEFVEIESAVPGSLPQHLRDLLTLLVGDALLGGFHAPSCDSLRMDSGYSARAPRQALLGQLLEMHVFLSTSCVLPPVVHPRDSVLTFEQVPSLRAYGGPWRGRATVAK